jgi:hypothetical protein
LKIVRSKGKEVVLKGFRIRIMTVEIQKRKTFFAYKQRTYIHAYTDFFDTLLDNPTRRE